MSKTTDAPDKPAAPDKPEKEKRKRGSSDPFAAIPWTEVRAFAMTEAAFELLDSAAQSRLAWQINAKYGAQPPVRTEEGA